MAKCGLARIADSSRAHPLAPGYLLGPREEPLVCAKESAVTLWQSRRLKRLWSSRCTCVRHLDDDARAELGARSSPDITCTICTAPTPSHFARPRIVPKSAVPPVAHRAPSPPPPNLNRLTPARALRCRRSDPFCRTTVTRGCTPTRKRTWRSAHMSLTRKPSISLSYRRPRSKLRSARYGSQPPRPAPKAPASHRLRCHLRLPRPHLLRCRRRRRRGRKRRL